jgi:hypothetical protein
MQVFHCGGRKDRREISREGLKALRNTNHGLTQIPGAQVCTDFALAQASATPFVFSS